MYTRRQLLRTGASLSCASLAGCAFSTPKAETMFVMSYFKSDSPAMYLATSQDGYDWSSVNGGHPVLTGSIRTRKLRDPFLFRDREGTFHMLATDGWESQYIIHATSPNLIDWSDQEAIPAMTTVDGAKNTWAPECYYDRENDEYRLVWSSTVNPDIGEEWDNRIWSMTTEDFEEFSRPEKFFDPGYEVIDATVAYHDGTYHMAFKDERGVNEVDTDYKAIRTATAESGNGPFEHVSDLITPSPVEGPTLFRNDGEWWLIYDYFLEGYAGASRSSDFDTWETFRDQITFPSGLRHPSVIRVEKTLGEALQS